MQSIRSEDKYLLDHDSTWVSEVILSSSNTFIGEFMFRSTLNNADEWDKMTSPNSEDSFFDKTYMKGIKQYSDMNSDLINNDATILRGNVSDVMDNDEFNSVPCAPVNAKQSSLNCVATLDEPKGTLPKYYEGGCGGDQSLRREVFKQKQYECDICGAKVAWKCSLKTHKLIHTGEKPFECDICGKNFRQMSNLKSHMVVHTGEKKYKCQICGKRFAQSCSLKTHQYIHSGEKPYKCEVCGKSFAQASRLNIHKQIHTGKKYECDICGMKFTQKFILKGHHLMHAIKKFDTPYQCDTCGKEFAQMYSLAAHKLIHSGKKPYF